MSVESPSRSGVLTAGLVVAWLLAGGLLLVALAGSFELVSNLQHPRAACQDAASEAGASAVNKVETTWPPPMVRCEAKYFYSPNPIAHISAVTSKNLAVVAILDVVALAVIASNASPVARWWRRRSLRSRARSFARGLREAIDAFRTRPRRPVDSTEQMNG